MVLFIGGLVFGIWRTEMVLKTQLSSPKQQSLLIQVTSFSQSQQMSIRFRAKVLVPDKTQVRNIILSDYQKREWDIGSIWFVDVHLKPSIGTANIAGFNQEAWFISQHIDAVGSVGKNRLLEKKPLSFFDQLQKLRWSIFNKIERIGKHNQQGIALIQALILGETIGFNYHNWETFRKLGLSHLVSISGLHVGLVAYFSAIVLLFVMRLGLFFKVPTPNYPKLYCAIVGLISAWLYALIAGFSVPTQRSVIMISVITIGFFCRHYFTFWQIWWRALFVVLIFDPCSVLSVGFWLSFGMVAVILIYASGRVFSQFSNKFLLFCQLQLAISLMSLVMIAFFFQEIPILSPIVNLIAIPWFSLILIPLALLSLVIPLDIVSYLTIALAQYTMTVLTVVAKFAPIWIVSGKPWLIWLLSIIAGIVFLIPRGLGLRLWSLIILILLFFARPLKIPVNELKILVLDVGQGLSVLMQTRNHQLLFDTGNPPARMRVIPSLNKLGIKQLDVLVLSHPDRDHDGGAIEISHALQPKVIYAGEKDKYHLNVPALYCERGISWQWDGVFFEWLTSPLQYENSNDKSCVLRVIAGQYALLVTGDLGKKGEKELVQQYGDRLYSQVLILGHHGSKTSSSNQFINAVEPKYSIATTAYLNSYGHPHQQVLNILNAHDVKLYRTDFQGALEIRFSHELMIQPAIQYQPYWQKKPFKIND